MSSGVQDAVSLRVRAGAAKERGDDAAIEKARVSLIGRLRAREREIEDAIYARVSGMFTSASGEDADYETGLRATVAAAVNLSLTEMEDPAELPAPIPSVAIAQAHRAARRNISVDTMLLRYIGGHRMFGGVRDGRGPSQWPLLQRPSSTSSAHHAGGCARAPDDHDCPRAQAGARTDRALTRGVPY